jgi:rfaE bifunctional protein nucleotidyltransferase chain/domain
VPFVVPAPLVSTNDAIGAGDCFAVAATHALATGSVVTEAVESAVAAAAAFVGAGGVAGVDHVIADGAADAPAARVHAAGGTVVATGGCFDLMHAGHVALLQAARALGDCLVVLVNSDASVRRLKGRDRPYQTAADRAAVLRALACVDDVIVFDEDTPVDALERLRPEVFVKGADYSIDQLVESDVMARWHGQTVVVPYLAGRSTSRLLERMDYPRGD